MKIFGIDFITGQDHPRLGYINLDNIDTIVSHPTNKFSCLVTFSGSDEPYELGLSANGLADEIQAAQFGGSGTVIACKNKS